MSFEKLKEHKSFNGTTVFCQHQSQVTKTPMNFSYFRPDSEKIDHVIFWLSGLTCTEENFITKAGAQNILKNTKTLIVCPDTSPRGLDLENEHENYDFGSGASFYLNPTAKGYIDHYKMYDYLIDEFVPMIKEAFNVSKCSISGHSMGGHGALVLGLRNPKLFSKISAFSPIVNPMNVPWGQKAFAGYLGDDKEAWKKYDACELIKSGHRHPNTLLVEQGLDDQFYEEQLKTPELEKVCEQNDQPLQVNYRKGYDHSYYFIASFLESHLKYLSE